ncbi:MAG TPA: DnaJ domain-containing protein [Deltaproteobacteria bacterium]|nr:DnaJ domain-containing protein [Deltaproteobacteria bacterium]HPR54564.1 DnaJ domain-containing protein [Deltaproteobacteria bacterium]HXK47357.1 DnaJ domain-containing protein [Deltaproteobacteria bacterium]
MVRRDYYLILGVSPQENEEGIREAFRRLVKKYHPDIAGPLSRWEFQEIVEAYEVLCDPDRRRSYDQGLAHAEGRERIIPEPIVTGTWGYGESLVPEPVSIMRDFLSVSQPIDSLFERIFRNFTHTRVPKSERPESLTMELIFSPEEAMTGGRVPISIPVLYPCPACRGSGRSWPYQCPQCMGRGMVEEEEQVTLQIPPRVPSGTVFEVPLAGLGVHNFYLRVVVRISELY